MVNSVLYRIAGYEIIFCNFFICDMNNLLSLGFVGRERKHSDDLLHLSGIFRPRRISQRLEICKQGQHALKNSFELVRHNIENQQLSFSWIKINLLPRKITEAVLKDCYSSVELFC